MADKFTLSGVWTLAWYDLNWNPQIDPKTKAKYDDWEIEFKPDGWNFEGHTGSEQNHSKVTGEMYEWSDPAADATARMRTVALHMKVGSLVHHVHCGTIPDAPRSTAPGAQIRGYWVGVAGGQGGYTLTRKDA